MLRTPIAADFPMLLALNNAHAAEVGALSPEALAQLVEIAFRTRIVAQADAFLIALKEGADYPSPNYRWFSERFERFAYVDRVVVASSARKKGLGRALYDDVIEAARVAGAEILACEVNVDPPNPVSDAFHAALGFAEIGRARLADRGKTVRYLVLPVREDA